LATVGAEQLLQLASRIAGVASIHRLRTSGTGIEQKCYACPSATAVGTPVRPAQSHPVQTGLKGPRS
ncbi:hypothetical protein, partial [Amycolatopsis magusensis]